MNESKLPEGTPCCHTGNIGHEGDCVNETVATLHDLKNAMFIVNEQVADGCACATCSYLRWIREKKPWLITR